MHDFEKVLQKFGNLSEFVRFLNEKINDGEQISNGKTGAMKTKEQKLKEAEPPAPPAGGAEAGAEAGVVIDPTAAPGSQITIGNKQPDNEFQGNYTDEIKLSGNHDVVNTKPKAKINFSNGTY